MADALKDYGDASFSARDIADKYGVSMSTLTVWARKAGVKLRGRGRTKQTQPDSNTRRILEAAEVMPQEVVGRQFGGVTKQRISKILKRWQNWRKPDRSPFVTEDVIRWKGKHFKVLQPGPLFGKVVNEHGEIMHNFYWHMGGSLAVKTDPSKMKIRGRKAR